jgi:hypothetical protein
MISTDRCACFVIIPCDSRVGGTEPAKYPSYSNRHSSIYTEHSICFHLPGRSNGSVKIHYFNGPAVDRDEYQPEELGFGYINGRPAGASFDEPDQPLQAIRAFFQSIEESTLERVFQEWMDRLVQCFVAVGGLVEGTYKV